VGVNRREDPDSLLGSDDLGGIEFGALGTEAGSDLNWFKLLTARAQERASKSSAYQWWVLWSLLAGLFALNFTFTVFKVVVNKQSTFSITVNLFDTQHFVTLGINSQVKKVTT